MPEDTMNALLKIDRLVHEPARLAIISILYQIESADFLYLIRETGATKGNLSSHLTKLEEGGYIRVEKMFKGKMPMTILHLTDAGGEAFRAYCDLIREVILPGGDERKSHRK